MSRTVEEAQKPAVLGLLLDAGREVDGDAGDIAVVVDFDLAGVDSSTDLDADAAEGVAELHATFDSQRRRVEHGEQAVASALHDAAAMLVDEAAGGAVVAISTARQLASPIVADCLVDRRCR